MTRALRSLGVLLLLLPGCQRSQTQLVLTVDSTRPVQVDELTVRLTRGDQTATEVTLLQGAAVTLPPARDFTIPLTDKQRQDASLVVRARVRGAEVVSISQQATIVPGDTARLRVNLLGEAALAVLSGKPGGLGSADGTGATARFSGPGGAAVDGAGNLYVADTNNCTIRRMVIATGEVTTLAGAPGKCGSADGTGAAARFSFPTNLTVDGTGNLYVADTGNYAIRRIVIATGAVTTLAGTPETPGSADGIGAAASFNGPNGIVADRAGNLYVVDTYNNTIRRIVIATGEVTTLAGSAGNVGSGDGVGSAASFTFPIGITTDGSGTLYVADTGNDTLRAVVIATGEVTTLAGTPGLEDDTDGVGAAAHFVGPSGITADGAGNLYVAEVVSSIIRRVGITSRQVTSLIGLPGIPGSADGGPGVAAFAFPTGIAAAAADSLLLADTGNNAIRRIVPSTAQVSTLAGAADASGRTDGAAAVARFTYPNDVTTDGTGNLYVADSSNHTIRRIALGGINTGDITTLAGTAGRVDSTDGTGAAAGFNFPSGIASDGAGNLLVADRFNHTIRRIVIARGDVTTLAGSPRFSGSTDGTGGAARFGTPASLTTDGAGNVYVTDMAFGTIRRVVVATGEVTTLAGSAGNVGSDDGVGTAATFNEPDGITTDGAGNLYVADAGNDAIRRIVIATGQVTTFAGSPGNPGTADGTGASARFHGPSGIAADGAGGLYVADGVNHTLRRIVIATGQVTTVAGQPGQGTITPGTGVQGRLNGPRGIAVLGLGFVAVTCPAENVILLGRGL